MEVVPGRGSEWRRRLEVIRGESEAEIVTDDEEEGVEYRGIVSGMLRMYE